MLGTSWWEGHRDRGTFPQCNLGRLRGGAWRGQRSTTQLRARDTQPNFSGNKGHQTNQSALSPCLTMRPQKRSRWAGTGAVAPGSRSDPIPPPPHPTKSGRQQSNLALALATWTDGGDGLNATKTTPTFLCGAYVMVGVNVAHPPSHFLTATRIRRDQSPCPAILPADHAPRSSRSGPCLLVPSIRELLASISDLNKGVRILYGLPTPLGQQAKGKTIGPTSHLCVVRWTQAATTSSYSHTTSDMMLRQASAAAIGQSQLQPLIPKPCGTGKQRAGDPIDSGRLLAWLAYGGWVRTSEYRISIDSHMVDSRGPLRSTRSAMQCPYNSTRYY